MLFKQELLLMFISSLITQEEIQLTKCNSATHFYHPMVSNMELYGLILNNHQIGEIVLKTVTF